MCGGEGGRSCQEGWEGSRKEEHHPPTPESWKDLAAQEEAFFPAAAAAEGVSARQGRKDRLSSSFPGKGGREKRDPAEKAQTREKEGGKKRARYFRHAQKWEK